MKVPYLSFRNKPTLLVPEAIRYRPYVRLRVHGSVRHRTIWAVLDTGADITVLPRALAEEIGVTILAGEKRTARGVSGEAMEIVAGEVGLEIGDSDETHRWSSLIGFADFAHPKQQRAILGHVGFFDQFRVTFDGVFHEVDIQRN